MQTLTPDAPDTRLVKNKSGNWEIRWTERDDEGISRTRSYSCRTKSQREAETIRRAWEGSAAVVKQALGGVTVDQLLAAYIAQHIRPKGLAASQEFALRWVQRLLTHVEVETLDHRQIDRYVAARRGSKKVRRGDGPVADSTIRRELGALRAAVAWGQKKGWVSPTFSLAFDMPAPGAPRENALSEEDEARMMEAATKLATDPGLPFVRRRIGVFVALALQTAARRGAMRGLTWDRVDFARGVIDYRDPSMRTTRKRRARVPMSDALRVVLTDLHKRMVAGEPGTDPRWVLGHDGDVRTAWATFLADHGFPEDTTLHDLRRTWATLRVQWGASLEDVAAVLGDTIATTEKHYAHHSPDYLRGAINMTGPRGRR